MKRAKVAALLAAAVLLLGGCSPIKCLFPLYTEADKLFDGNLIGEWRIARDNSHGEGKNGINESERWVFQKTQDHLSYDCTQLELGKKGVVWSTVKLVKLGDVIFADFEPGPAFPEGPQDLSYPRIDARVARALPWLAALTVLTLLGVSRAGAVEAPPQSAPEKATEKAAPPTRPPISPAAVKQATTPAPSNAGAPAPSKATTTAPPASSSAAPDSGMTLRGGQDRTDFRTMTVEGEDRVHLEVERPQLTLDLDPEKVGGLESGTAGDVLNRVAPDLMTAYLESSSHGQSPYLAHPWLRLFATGSVARFQPNVKDVDRWKLMVADSKGQTVTTFQGKGDPPKEIAWDGRSQGGALCPPSSTGVTSRTARSRRRMTSFPSRPPRD